MNDWVRTKIDDSKYINNPKDTQYKEVFAVSFELGACQNLSQLLNKILQLPQGTFQEWQVTGILHKLPQVTLCEGQVWAWQFGF